MCAEPERGRQRQRAARVFGDDKCCTAVGQFFGSNLSTLRVGQDRRCAHPEGILNELRAVNFRARKGEEKRPFFDIAAVDGQSRNGRVTPALCAQTKRCEG
jgi:hypothetical protein